MKKLSPDKWQKYLPQHMLSRLVGWLTDRKWGALTQYVIKKFIDHYRVDMREAVEEDYRAYSTFNDFFTRHIKSELRPISTGEVIASPVDGTISQFGKLSENVILQAKNRCFTVESLLGGDEYSQSFHRGSFFTAYLAPRNYHRIHMPVGGRLIEMRHVPGRLFSVNPECVHHIDELFARNERVIAFFETPVGMMAVVMVGALFVGSVWTAWHGRVTPPTQKTLTSYNYSDKNISYSAGQEIGHFQMGSTVIVLFPEDVMEWNASLEIDQEIQYGECIGRIHPSRLLNI